MKTFQKLAGKLDKTQENLSKLRENQELEKRLSVGGLPLEAVKHICERSVMSLSSGKRGFESD